jgi:hypothetical protein
MDNQNTESQSTLDKVTSVLFRKLAAPIALTVGLAGCFNASGYRPLNKDEMDLRDEVRNAQYETDVGTLAKQTLAEATMTGDELVAKGEIKAYVTPEGYNALAQTFAANSVEGQALVELNNSNQYLSNLFSGAKITRHALRSLKSNVDSELFVRYAKMNREDMEAVADNLKNLSVSIAKIGVPQREALMKLNNADAAAMLDYNEKALRTINSLFTAIADTETHEGHLDKVCDAQKYSALILKSLTGHDQYGKIEGEGRQVLNKLLEQKAREVVGPRTDFAKEYCKNGTSLTLNDAYKDLLEKTYEEASDFGEASLETICNVYMGKALEMTKEARRQNYITTKQLLAVNRVVAKDFLDKMGTAAQDADADSVKVFKDILFPAIPGYSLVSMVLNFGGAFTNDSYSPEGKTPEAKYEKTLVDGNAINNGFQTRDNFPGSLKGYRVRFASASISTAMQIAAGIYFATKGGKGSDGGGSSAPATSSSGGDTITPGTGPR